MNAIAVQPSKICLPLADGGIWNILPADPSAAVVTRRLGEIMMLPACWRESAPSISVRTLDRPGRFFFGTPLRKPLVCTIPPPDDIHLEWLGVLFLAGVLVQAAIRRDGMLVHGALAVSGDAGVVLEGPANAGKTTASNRLPAGLTSWCDDATLILADRRSQYRAHPWPTWSRFMVKRGGGAWTTSDHVALRAICFISSQSVSDPETVTPSWAVGRLVRSNAEAARPMEHRWSDAERRSARLNALNISCRIVREVPCYRIGVANGVPESVARLL